MSNHNQIPGRNVLWTIHTLFLLLSSFTSRASPPRFNLGYFGLSSTNKTQSTATGDAKMWSSFLTVDPAKIMGLLITRGGLVLPKYIQDELISTARVCSVDDAQLNLLERKMLFSNFTVALPGSPKAVQVGRFYMTWDSYLKPCVDIELDDVTILVEFTNLMLTRTNWNELQDAGFPPETAMSTSDELPSSFISSTFLRFSSIDLSGTVKAKLRSRPLDRDIAPILAFDLDSLDHLNAQIQRYSDINLSQTGRRGCTTDELYLLIQDFVTEKVRVFVASAAYDLVTNTFQEGDTAMVRDAKRLISEATSSILNYAVDASKAKGKDIHLAVANRLENIGLPVYKLEQFKIISENMSKNWGLPKETLSSLKKTFLSASEAAMVRIAEAKLKDMQGTHSQVAQQQQQNIIFFPEFP